MEYQVLVDDDPERPAGADGDGWLDVEVALDDALAGAAHILLGGLADGADEIALGAEGEFGADAEERRQQDLNLRPSGYELYVLLSAPVSARIFI